MSASNVAMTSSNDPTRVVRDLSAFSLEELQSNPDTRGKALGLSKQLVSLLEDPVDTATQLVFSPYVATTARMAVGLDLFTVINTHEQPIKTARVAALCKAEELLISTSWRSVFNLLLNSTSASASAPCCNWVCT